MKLVPDTSAVIDGRVSDHITSDTSDTTPSVLVPEAVIGELEAQANRGEERGLDGLSELQRLTQLADEDVITLEYVGDRATPGEAAQASDGTIDARIRDLAEEHSATLLTGDSIQAEVAKAKGIPVTYVKPDTGSTDGLEIESYFDDETMSVHLKTGTRPKAKRGSIGEMSYEAIADEVTSEQEMANIADEIEGSVHTNPDSFLDLSEPGMSIVQYENYRIAVARPPFADTIEITAVRPIAKTTIDDYDFADEFRDRFLESERGVLIAGAPGAGKSTFAQAVAEFLNDHDYAVKTMEKPRDLQVGPEITQYTELAGQMENTADALLLVRPDYTIYDEVRKTRDFEVFSDMRLAGVGMVGVVHATRAIDALQRLVGRVELGMIPQIVDTVVYIEAGEIATIYDVTTEVKIPEGMEAEDLVRPVIQVEDFETGEPEYEIYTFNGQVVTTPLDGEATAGNPTGDGMVRLAEQEIEAEIRALTNGFVAIDVQNDQTAIAYVEEDEISAVIGRDGARITEVEDRLGVHIDVRPLSERTRSDRSNGHRQPGAVVDSDITRNAIEISLDGYSSGDAVEVHCDGEYLFTATVGHNNMVQMSRGTVLGDEVEEALENGAELHVLPA